MRVEIIRCRIAFAFVSSNGRKKLARGTEHDAAGNLAFAALSRYLIAT